MKEKFRAFYDSIGFSVAMSIIAVAALMEKVIGVIVSGDYYRQFVLIIVWVIIIYHFVKETNDKRKAKNE